MKHTRSALVACCALLALFGLPAQAGSSERSFQARLGGFLFEGESDFWDDNASVFALEASDFDDTTLGLTYSVPFNRFFEVDLNADLFEGTVISEYRDFTDASGFPVNKNCLSIFKAFVLSLRVPLPASSCHQDIIKVKLFPCLFLLQ